MYYTRLTHKPDKSIFFLLETTLHALQHKQRQLTLLTINLLLTCLWQILVQENF